MKVCIVGGGLMGMALAYRLARDGNAVTVLETKKQLGGLATWEDFGDFVWDRFYHVILPTDQDLIRFVSEIGLADALEWRRTYTGFYVDKCLYSISSNLEFLRFPYLSILSKARLAWTMLYCSRIKDWRRLERVTVEDFLTRVSGRETYERLWRPLLLAKLGNNYTRVSAVFIWSYIKRMFSARDKSASAEHLGHVSGGYRMIFDKLEAEILRMKGTIRADTAVSSIRSSSSNKLQVESSNSTEQFDQVICTSPVSVLQRIVAPELIEATSSVEEIEYLGVICVVVVSNIPLVPFYVVNVADSELPFTGVIGMSTVIDPKHTGGRYLTYLPKYVLSSDREMDTDDEEVKKSFLEGIKRMLPEFDEGQIVSLHVHRARRVQPLQVLDYSRLVPDVQTRHPGLFVLNTSQFTHSTLNNNEVIATVNRFYSEYQDSHGQDASASDRSGTT